MQASGFQAGRVCGGRTTDHRPRRKQGLAPFRVLEEVRNTRPLSVLMAEQVQALRDWARSRTVPAD